MNQLRNLGHGESGEGRFSDAVQRIGPAHPPNDGSGEHMASPDTEEEARDVYLHSAEHRRLLEESILRATVALAASPIGYAKHRQAELDRLLQ